MAGEEVAADADVDAATDVVADVVVIVVEVEAGETLPLTPTTSGRRGTRIEAPKPQLLATAVGNLASSDPSA